MSRRLLQVVNGLLGLSTIALGTVQVGFGVRSCWLSPSLRDRLLIGLPALVAIALAGCGVDEPKTDRSYQTWEVYLGDKAATQYSSLDQINAENVDQLEIAWTYRTGDAEGLEKAQIQTNPIIVDDVLYGRSPKMKLFALRADTGEEIWSFDPFDHIEIPSGPAISRGLIHWEDPETGRARLVIAAASYLLAVDAETGELITDFGSDGLVDLRDGLDRDVSGLHVEGRTPGVVYKHLLIQGTSLSEGPATAPGHIRAYDLRTGEIEWIFHTIPHPDEFGYETWPEDAYLTIGGANAWSGLTLDEERGIVYLPIGSAAFDFWGGNRIGSNLFANTILALDASTGERIWHFQGVHHDILDRDFPASPTLVTVRHDGRIRDAVAVTTKTGHVFLLDRDTGDPLFPVEERPVPASDLRGEEAWPTQPLPIKPPPIARQQFSEDSLTDISPEARADALERYRGLRWDGPFTPPSIQGTLIWPGFDGGAEWGGAAFDPNDGMLYVNSNEMPWILEMVDLTEYGDRSSGEGLYVVHCAGCHGLNREGSTGRGIPPLTSAKDSLNEAQVRGMIRNGRGFMPSFGFLSEVEIDELVDFLFDRAVPTAGLEDSADSDTRQMFNDFAGAPYGHTGYNKFRDADGNPAVKPPWGTLNKIDLNEGEIVWRVLLGEFDYLTERGIPQTGAENYGGPVVTAGGLIFIGATRDEMFRAFDKETGEVLWETKLPAGGYATPATYQVDGRQYVVIAAGGGKMDTKPGDAYIALALSATQTEQ